MREYKDIHLTRTQETWVRVYDDEIEEGDTHSDAAYEMASWWDHVDDDWEIVGEGTED